MALARNLNANVSQGLRRAVEIYALEHHLTLSQAMRLILSRAVMPPAPYMPPSLPNWQVEAWTALLRGLFRVKHLVLTSEVKAMLVDAISTLNERDAQVLRLRFGLDGPRHTQTEVAAAMGWERQRAHQVEQTALARVRGWCRGKGIWDLIGEQLLNEEE